VSQTVHNATPKVDDDEASETILVVEDEDVVREFVCEVLDAHGYNVLEAMLPHVALKIVGEREERIDFLLTDVIMPQMNGRELCRHIVADRPDIKVLYMSGYTDNIIGDDGILDEGVNFLQKPFAVPDLLSKIRSIIDEPA